MEYIVSARKYRPMTFDSVVGQAALTTTLKNAVKSGKLAHAYLFCGPRGVGKTTCARIFAKAINCMHPTEDGEACNECESCQAFNEQRSYNIFELDAASNNSVENIKSLMDQTRIPPQVGRYKVFIIDEVHMLSTAAFNAFLKTLEEPPAHVIFILATTEKHKILPTILSRCQIYDFERMTVANTVNHLKMVAEKEGIQYEEEALAVIAEKADGGMRDALSIFDQTASFAQGNITYQKAIEDLNVLDAENYFNIINLALENKVPDIMVLLNNVINKGFDGGLLINGLASHVRNVLMAKDPQTLPLLEVSEQQRQRYQQQAQNCPTPFLYKALKLMNQCDVEYRQSSNKRLLVELTLIQVAQITQPDDDGVSAGRSPKRLKSLFRKLFQTVKPEPAAQVAGAKRVSGKTDENTPLPNHSSQAKSPNEPKVVKSAQPKITLGSLSMSFSNILNDGKGTRTETQELEIKNKEEKKPFTEDDLLFQWHAMCKRMQSIDKLKGLATRMRNIIPSITTYPHVEIVAENDILQREIEDIKKRIRITLANELHNADITISIRLAKQEEIKPLLRPNELFDKIKKENPAIAKLSEVLLLDLA
jgi:DNA polymerase-3 subunit gamma/tau